MKTTAKLIAMFLMLASLGFAQGDTKKADDTKAPAAAAADTKKDDGAAKTEKKKGKKAKKARKPMPLLPPPPQASKLYLLSVKNQERPKLDFAYRHFRLITGVPFSFGRNLSFGQNPGPAYLGALQTASWGDRVMVLDFFSTHIESGLAVTLLIVTTMITPVGERKAFLGGSIAQSM